MSLPNNTPQILYFLRPTARVWDINVKEAKGTRAIEIEFFNTAKLGPQPTEQEIIDAGNDLTPVNGQVFSEWQAEHGGDQNLTNKRLAREILNSDQGIVFRAVLTALVKAIQAGQLRLGGTITKQQIIAAVIAEMDSE